MISFRGTETSETRLMTAREGFGFRPHRFSALAVVLLLVLMSAPSKAQEGTLGEAPRQPDGALSAAVEPEQDAVLQEGLEARFDRIPGLEEVEAQVEAGIVTLTGRVLEESDREDAASLARRVEGVARVEDDIEVVVNPVERLRPALVKALDRLQSIVSYLPLLLVSLLLVVFFVFLSRLVARWDGLFRRLTVNPFARDLVQQAVRVGVILTGVLVALEILDATALVGAVLGTAGVIGLAVGFAFRDLVENYIASILLSIRQPFAPNDHVVIDGEEGKVVRLTSRATILMTLDGNHLRIPNSQVFKGVTLNYTRNPRRRFDIGVGIGVGEDLVEAQRLGIETLQALPGVLDEPPPVALIEDLGDSNVLVRFFGWVDQREASFLKVKSEAIRAIKTVLEDAGMDLPEPIYRVHMVEPGPFRQKPVAESSAVPSQVARPQQGPSDIAPDHHLDRQIAEDRAATGTEADLLDTAAPTE